jgi:hypothetical protein
LQLLCLTTSSRHRQRQTSLPCTQQLAMQAVHAGCMQSACRHVLLQLLVWMTVLVVQAAAAAGYLSCC